MAKVLGEVIFDVEQTLTSNASDKVPSVAAVRTGLSSLFSPILTNEVPSNAQGIVGITSIRGAILWLANHLGVPVTPSISNFTVQGGVEQLTFLADSYDGSIVQFKNPVTNSWIDGVLVSGSMFTYTKVFTAIPAGTYNSFSARLKNDNTITATNTTSITVTASTSGNYQKDVLYGNSMYANQNSSFEVPYTSYVTQQIADSPYPNDTYSLINRSEGGKTTSYLYNKAQGEFSTYYDANARFFTVIIGDLYNGLRADPNRTAQQEFDTAKDFAIFLKSFGSNIRVVIQTPPQDKSRLAQAPTDPTFNSRANQLAVLIRNAKSSNVTWLDAVDDVRANTGLDPANVNFSDDGIHYFNQGQSIFAHLASYARREACYGTTQPPLFLADPNYLTGYSALTVDTKDAEVVINGLRYSVSSGNSGYNHKVLFAQKMPANSNSSIAIKTTGKDGILLVGTSKILTKYQDSKAGIFPGGGTQFSIVDLGTPAPANLDSSLPAGYMILDRTGNSLKAYYSDGLAAPVLRQQFTYSSTVDLYIYGDIEANGYIDAPQGMGLVNTTGGGTGNLLPTASYNTVPTKRADGQHVLVESNNILTASGSDTGYGYYGLLDKKTVPGTPWFVAIKIAANNAQNGLLQAIDANVLGGYNDGHALATIWNANAGNVGEINNFAQIGGSALMSESPSVDSYILLKGDANNHVYGQYTIDNGASFSNIVDFGVISIPLYFRVDLIGQTKTLNDSAIYYLQSNGLVDA